MAALISTAYRAPHLSLCVRRTLTLFLTVRRLVKRHNPRIAELFAELRRVGKNRDVFGKKCRNTLATQIQRQTIKGLFLHVTCTSNDIIVQLWLCDDEQSSCDELMEFKQIQMRAQPEESLKHNHSCTMMSLLVQVT